MKVIIAGSRGFNNYGKLCDEVDDILKGRTNITIISGTAKGADRLGERYAEERGYNLLRFPANWDKHGRSAGYKRNLEMAKAADICICFWDGHSRGTEHMINHARIQCSEVHTIKYTS
jgi:predicted TIM-barrel fold metal-dependent hydrolase